MKILIMTIYILLLCSSSEATEGKANEAKEQMQRGNL